MKGIGLSLLCAFVIAAQAQVVGTFDNTRLFTDKMNLAEGEWMTRFRESFLSRGVPITTTSLLTPQYLASVSVFVTSEFVGQVPSTDEVNAMVAWVQAGGTLVVTGECG